MCCYNNRQCLVSTIVQKNEEDPNLEVTITPKIKVPVDVAFQMLKDKARLPSEIIAPHSLQKVHADLGLYYVPEVCISP